MPRAASAKKGSSSRKRNASAVRSDESSSASSSSSSSSSDSLPDAKRQKTAVSTDSDEAYTKPVAIKVSRDLSRMVLWDVSTSTFCAPFPQHRAELSRLVTHPSMASTVFAASVRELLTAHIGGNCFKKTCWCELLRDNHVNCRHDQARVSFSVTPSLDTEKVSCTEVETVSFRTLQIPMRALRSLCDQVISTCFSNIHVLAVTIHMSVAWWSNNEHPAPHEEPLQHAASFQISQRPIVTQDIRGNPVPYQELFYPGGRVCLRTVSADAQPMVDPTSYYELPAIHLPELSPFPRHSLPREVYSWFTADNMYNELDGNGFFGKPCGETQPYVAPDMEEKEEEEEEEEEDDEE